MAPGRHTETEGSHSYFIPQGESRCGALARMCLWTHMYQNAVWILSLCLKISSEALLWLGYVFSMCPRSSCAKSLYSSVAELGWWKLQEMRPSGWWIRSRAPWLNLCYMVLLLEETVSRRAHLFPEEQAVIKQGYSINPALFSTWPMASPLTACAVDGKGHPYFLHAEK